MKRKNINKPLHRFNLFEELVRSHNALDRQFPDIRVTFSIGVAAGKIRLWWRRPDDADFLTIRLGRGKGSPSFKVEAPNFASNPDPLDEYSAKLLDRYKKIDDLPFLVDLKRVGSLAVCSGDQDYRLELVRRLLADVAVHHSPEDVEIFVVSDHPKAADDWSGCAGSHIPALSDPGNEIPHLLFENDRINSFVDNFKNIFFQRLETVRSYSSNVSTLPRPIIIVILDDLGAVRQTSDIARSLLKDFRLGFFSFLSQMKKFLGPAEPVPRLIKKINFTILNQSNQRDQAMFFMGFPRS